MVGHIVVQYTTVWRSGKLTLRQKPRRRSFASVPHPSLLLPRSATIPYRLS